ncbi:MAG: FCD domain-containing protein [Synergistaceae bacterium]|jgi:DNA-binding FadR family transcriptional regulator|nr:FCD domain-containing protein [Synergistaceae bacterium]MDD3963378.1 FCD domain-containing protein [Synergistaceae bacterium]
MHLTIGGVFKVRSKDEDLINMIILETAEASNVPVGAGTVSVMLRKKGVNLSEAGAGRILRSLREKGLLTKVGFQGHVTTKEGTKKLSVLRNARQTAENLDNLLKNSGNLKGHSVTDIVTVRKAIEREAAMHAALKATPGDIARLEKIIEQQYREMERRSYYADISTEFHREIIRIARVPLLKIMYEFIGLSVEWHNFFIETFRISDTPLNITHEKIMEAIKKGDPREAADLMEAHLNDVIESAGNFSALYGK